MDWFGPDHADKNAATKLFDEAVRYEEEHSIADAKKLFEQYYTNNYAAIKGRINLKQPGLTDWQDIFNLLGRISMNRPKADDGVIDLPRQAKWAGGFLGCYLALIEYGLNAIVRLDDRNDVERRLKDVELYTVALSQEFQELHIRIDMAPLRARIEHVLQVVPYVGDYAPHVRKIASALR